MAWKLVILALGFLSLKPITAITLEESETSENPSTLQSSTEIVPSTTAEATTSYNVVEVDIRGRAQYSIYTVTTESNTLSSTAATTEFSDETTTLVSTSKLGNYGLHLPSGLKPKPKLNNGKIVREKIARNYNKFWKKSYANVKSMLLRRMDKSRMNFTNNTTTVKPTTEQQHSPNEVPETLPLMTGSARTFSLLFICFTMAVVELI